MKFKNTLLACSLSVLLVACGGGSDSDSNAAPKAGTVSISGTAAVGQVLTGKYAYSDAESDAEGVTTFRWLRDGVAIANATKSTYTVTEADAGKKIIFAVTPVASSGTAKGTEVKSSASSIPAAEAAPTAEAVSIEGTLTVGQTLTGKYTFKDVNEDPEGTSTFKWYRDNKVIAGAVAKTYKLVSDDQGKKIIFGVTPVATKGTKIGEEVKSAAKSIPAANTVPTAIDVKITGTPSVGETLTGTYTYKDADNDKEGQTVFSWLRNDTTLPGETKKTYKVTQADIGNKIYFGVTPVALTGEKTGKLTKSSSVTGAASVLSKKCNDTTDAGFVDAFVNKGVADRAFVNNVPSATAVEQFSVDYLAGQFNAARAKDDTVKDKLKMPSQSVWDGYSASEKMLYLINSERCARGLVPFEGIDPRVVKTADDWAKELSDTNRFSHGPTNGTNNVPERLERAGLTSANVDSLAVSGGLQLTIGENLTAFFKGTQDQPKIGEVEARSVYFWMYEDFANGNNYGHRKLLMRKFGGDNDHGSADTEGLFGAALRDKEGTNGAFKTSRVVAAMHIFDPKSSYKLNAGDVITPAPAIIPPASDDDCQSEAKFDASTVTCK